MATGNMLAGGDALSLQLETSTVARSFDVTGTYPEPVILFDAGLAEYVLTRRMPVPDALAAAASVEVHLEWSMVSATANEVVLSVQVRRGRDGENGFTRAFPTAVTATVTVPGTAGLSEFTTITLTNAEADSIAAGDTMQVRIGRVGNDGSDDATGDLQLKNWWIEQA